MINNIQKKNDFSLMAPMHTLLSGIKALFCDFGNDGIKNLRECCGGAGFHKFSGFAGALDAMSALVTLEGDSVVMNLQTARSLLKNGKSVLKKGKKMNKSLEYIQDLPLIMKDTAPFGVATDDKKFFSDVQNLLALLKRNALMQIGHALSLYADPKYNEFNDWEKFYQKFQIELVQMAQMHSYFIAANCAIKGVGKLRVDIDSQIGTHLNTLIRIFCYNTLLTKAAPLAVTHYLKPGHFQTINSLLNEDIKTIRPQVLNLIEAYEMDDNFLFSAIGTHDGMAIEKLFDQASASKLNDRDVLKGFKEHITPLIMQGKL